MAQEPTTCRCGFDVGERVRMKSSLLRFDGQPFGFVHGRVESSSFGCGHIVMWEEMSTATVLPNDHVIRD